MTRTISGRAASAAAADVLQSAIVAEFLSPGPRLTLHAAALANPPVVDNRRNAFRSLLPDFGYRELRVIDALRELLTRGTVVDLAYRDAARSAAFIERLEAAFRLDPPAGEVRLLRDDTLSETGLLGGAFFLGGGLEWGADGLVVGPAGATFQTAGEVAAVRARWSSYWEAKSGGARVLR